MLACGRVCKWLSRALIDVGGSSPLWAIHSLVGTPELYKRGEVDLKQAKTHVFIFS